MFVFIDIGILQAKEKIMNLREFKKIVSASENYEETFRIFRVWVNNCYDAYCKEMKAEYAEKERFYDEEYDFFAS